MASSSARSEEPMEVVIPSETSQIDKLSELPKHIIHHIMSLLPTEDSTRMSLLSTRFLAAWRSFPEINFDCQSFCRTGRLLPEFLSFARESLRRRQLDSNVLEKLTFTVDFRFCTTRDAFSSADAIGTMADFAMNNKVRELVLEGHYDIVGGLPGSVFSCRSITTMRLYGIQFRNRNKNFVLSCPLIEVLSLVQCRSLTGTRITLSSRRLKSARFEDCVGFCRVQIEGAAASLESFSVVVTTIHAPIFYGRMITNLGSCKSLKCLELRGSAITDEWFRNTVSGLVALEALEMRDCRTLKNVSLRNDRLRRMDLQECRQIENVNVVARNLEFFRHSICFDQNAPYNSGQCRINIGQRRHLKELILKGVKGNLTDEWIEKNFTLLNGFQSLENLVLEDCDLLEEVKFSARSLKTLELIGCKKLQTAEIDAPNLKSLVYAGAVLPSPSLIVTSFYLSAELNLLLKEKDYANLRNFLSYFGHCKSLTLVCKCDKLQLIFPDEQRFNLVSPMYDLKHLNVRLIGKVSNCTTVQLIDNMLWLAPQLDTLYIFFDSKEYVALRFYYYLQCPKKYVKNPPQCCSSHVIKCWRHYLTRVEVKAFEGFKLDASDLQRFFMNKANATVHTQTINKPLSV